MALHPIRAKANVALNAILAVGLHLAINWERVVAAVRAIRQPRRPAPARPSTQPGGDAGRTLAYAAWILAAALVIAGGAYGVTRLLPDQQFVMVFTKGRERKRIAPPRELVVMREGQEKPNPGGFPKFAFGLATVAVVGIAGRTVLRLKL